MTNFTPAYRKAPTPVFASPAARIEINPLENINEVRVLCSQKLMAQVQGKRTATGAMFLNAVTPRLFAQCPTTQAIHAIPGMYVNFDNTADSIPAKLATALSDALLNTLEIPQLQYFFRLVDEATRTVIASDMPDRVNVPSPEAEAVPDFLKPTIDVTSDSGYQPDPKICARLYVYAEQNGVARRIGFQSIETRFVKQVNKMRELSEKGIHIQASVVPQTKLTNWLSHRANPQAADEVTDAIDALLQTAS